MIDSVCAVINLTLVYSQAVCKPSKEIKWHKNYLQNRQFFFYSFFDGYLDTNILNHFQVDFHKSQCLARISHTQEP